MPYGKDQDTVLYFLAIVERHVACPAPGNHQLAKIMFDGTTYQRMTLQYRNGLLDQFNRLHC